MHVRKPLSQWSMSSQIHGPRSLKIPRPAQVGGMVIVKTLASRWLILRVYLFLQGFAHRPYSWIPVKQFTLVAEKGTVQTPYFPVIRSMEKPKKTNELTSAYLEFSIIDNERRNLPAPVA